ncbi:hypothetical protein ACHAWU_010190 [Discostella pseudostelligera]|uniref:Aspartate/glutamate/uridylate kinase domain-containing protein n=1 Tax=Discostella pseudostelligera TaxID=259834 RepID=A0ABD3MCE7_9STRA
MNAMNISNCDDDEIIRVLPPGGAALVSSSVDPSFLSSVGYSCSQCTIDGSNVKTIKKRQFIVVHGAGSFGHHSAKRFGLRCGKAVFLEEFDHPSLSDKHCSATSTSEEAVMKQRYQMEALSKTRQSVQKLNAATVACLIQHGVNAIGISPGMTIHGLRAHGATVPPGTSVSDVSSQDGSYRAMQQLCETIQQSLQAGLVPVVHGDACLLYDGKRAGILGGDTIAEGLATLWNSRQRGKTDKRNSRISQVIFITDVAGVFTSDPKSDPNARLIRSLTIHEDSDKIVIENKEGGINKDKSAQLESDALNVSGSSHEHDVTGGLKAKLGAAVTIVQSGVKVIISQCCSSSTERYVKGDWSSIWDVEAGTLLTLSRNSVPS